jgi:hypothetical protein
METFGMRKRFLTLSLEKPKKNAEEILKNYELFIFQKCVKKGTF